MNCCQYSSFKAGTRALTTAKGIYKRVRLCDDLRVEIHGLISMFICVCRMQTFAGVTSGVE
jgi:hypothetical protein